MSKFNTLLESTKKSLLSGDIFPSNQSVFEEREVVNESGENRYVAEFDSYVWAKSDEEAIEIADEMCKILNDKYDGRCSTTSVAKQEQGTLGSTVIYTG